MAIAQTTVLVPFFRGVRSRRQENSRAELEVSVVQQFSDFAVDPGELVRRTRLPNRHEDDRSEAIAIADMNRILRVHIDLDDEMDALPDFEGAFW
jgi:hypothetical protein